MFKRTILIINLFASFLVLFFLSCPVQEESKTTELTYVKISRSNTFSGTVPAVYHINTTTYSEINYTLSNLNNNSVYYIFTNISTSSSKKNPIVYKNNSEANGETIPVMKSKNNIPTVYKKDKEIVREFNSNPFEFLEKHKAKGTIIESKKSILFPEPRKDTVGETKNFYNLIHNDTWSIENISATCRFFQNIKGKNLSVWVADDCWWIGGTKAYKVTPEMVNALVDKFLKADTTDDIYTLVSGIYGSHWGDHSYPTDFIPSSEQDNITILLYDIDNDNGNGTGGVTLGYFWSKDNYLNTKLKEYTMLPEGGSNERTMFYIDACLLAKKDDLTWEITDYWPNQMISTISHELQHMIHFYQKFIKNKLTNSSEAWLDEMCSLITEDFVSSKIGFMGPRGVSYNDPTAGSNNNDNGRLPLYNEYNDDSVIVWLSGDAVLRSYSIAYAFGAYLARNYDGVNLFQKIVQNTYTNYTAITNALSSLGYSDTFQTVLQKWGAAVICSNITNTPNYYKYNTGTWFTSINSNNITYDIGSINMFNYVTQPFLYSSQEVGYPTYSSLNKASNRFYLRATNFTGTIKDLIRIDDTVRLTVVVK